MTSIERAAGGRRGRIVRTLLAGVALVALAACEPVRFYDDFERPDAFSLGTAPEGLAWSAWYGTWQISGGTARPGIDYALATAPVTQPEGVAYVNVTSLSSEFWLVVRAADNGNYWRFGRWQGGPYQLQQISNHGIGSPEVTTVSTVSPLAGDRLSCTYQDSSIECSARGQLVATTEAASPVPTAIGLASFDPGGTGALTFDTVRVTDLPSVIDVSAAAAGPATVLTNGSVGWTVTASNSGTADRTEVGLAIDLPAGLSGASISPSQGSCSGVPVTCQLGALPANQSATVTVSGTAPASPGQLTIDATASTPADSAAHNDSTSHTTSVLAPALPGEEVVDSFTRTAPTLGSTEGGLPWSVGAGSFSTNGSAAVANGPGTSWASVNTPFSFGTLEVTVADTGNGQFWAVFGAVDSHNYFRVGPGGGGYYILQRVVNGVPQAVAQAFQRAQVPAADGDVIRVVRRPDDGILVMINGQHSIDAGDAANMTALGFGIAGGPGVAFDHFRVRSVLTAGTPATDSFNRANGDLGALDGNLAYPWWYGWGFGVNGNAAAPNNPYYSLAGADSSSELADVRVRVATKGSIAALVFRYAENGSYFLFGQLAAGGPYATTFVDTGGHSVPPAVEVLANPVPASGDVLEVRQYLDGRVEGVVNGVTVLRFIDTTTNNRATIYGVAGVGAESRFDDFVVTPR